jgi:enterochelin esterase-like enzyme
VARSRIISTNRKSLATNRDFFVYTPPGYDAKRKEPYPVLFLLHGLGDDAAAWTNVGAANVILDNLINQGVAKPMVMVNTLGYGTPDGPGGAMGSSMIPTFARALIEEVLPQVEKIYHVSQDRAQRAIAGLSMGGAESLYVGLHNTDRFAYIGSFSGAFVMWPRATPPSGGGRGGRGPQTMQDADFNLSFPDLNAKSASRQRLVWIACGLDDGLNTVNRQFKTWLKSKDIQFTDIEVPGYAHVWPLWRQNLAALAPLLFQGGGKSDKSSARDSHNSDRTATPLNQPPIVEALSTCRAWRYRAWPAPHRKPRLRKSPCRPPWRSVTVVSRSSAATSIRTSSESNRAARRIAKRDSALPGRC